VIKSQNSRKIPHHNQIGNINLADLGGHHCPGNNAVCALARQRSADAASLHAAAMLIDFPAISSLGVLANFQSE